MSQRTRAEWRDTILQDLGGDGVDPDLSERQLDTALSAALDLYNKHKPDLNWFPFFIPAAETTVITFFTEKPQSDEKGNPYGYVANVLNVSFADANRKILGPRAGFLEGYYLRWGYQGPRLFFQLHVAERNYERLTGSRPDWQWDRKSRVLYLSCPSRDCKAMVLCSRARLIDEIPYDQASDFRQLAVAHGKKILAQQLMRRGAMQGASGTIETDAKELRDEGKAEWDEIRTRLEANLVSVPPIGYIG